MKLKEKVTQFSEFINKRRVEVALSVTNFQDKNYAVIRDMNAIHFENSSIKFYELDNNFNPISSEIICKGEDPRIFSFDRQLYFISWILRGDKQDFDIFVINLTKGSKIELKHQSLNHYGKNWTFFAYNNMPFIIYSLDPLVIFGIDLETGKIWNHHADPNSISLGNYRGGSCGLQIGKEIAGLGHYTIDPSYHTLFSYNLNLKKKICTAKQVGEKNTSGVIDPYSFFKMGEDYYASITKSKDRWVNKKNHYVNEIWKLDIGI